MTITSWFIDHPIALIGVVAAFWFGLRFIVGPKRGAPGLNMFFAREQPVKLDGLGPAAITTLLETSRRFALAEPGLRGLILAGPFAAHEASAGSTVTLIFLAEAPEHYAGQDWVARWGYAEHGHPVLTIDTHAEDATIAHRLALRGAPPVTACFARMDRLEPPPRMQAALGQGAETLDDPTGLADKLRRRWIEQINHRKGTAA